MKQTVKILKRLPSAIAKTRKKVIRYQTSRAFKVFATFAFLKLLTTSGKLQAKGSWHQFIVYLASECRISPNSMYNRLAWMEEFRLITVVKGKSITLESWDTISREYRVTNNEFYEIEITDESPALEYILKKFVLQENISRQQYMFEKNISNNRVKQVLHSILPQGFKTMKEMAENILKCQKESFVTRSDSFDFFHSLRADFTCSIKSIARQFKFVDTRSCVYLKKVLKAKGLINYEHRRFESATNTRKATDVFNGLKVAATHFWDDVKKIRVWVLPDALTFTA